VRAVRTFQRKVAVSSLGGNRRSKSVALRHDMMSPPVTSSAGLRVGLLLAGSVMSGLLGVVGTDVVFVTWVVIVAEVA
jgi:hypothetical protein